MLSFVFLEEICLIFFGRGGNFEFLRGLHKSSVQRGAQLDKHRYTREIKFVISRA